MNTKFHIWDNGDMSVGIPAGESTVETFVQEGELENVRSLLKETFTTLHDFPVTVMTEEEFKRYTEGGE